MTLADRLGIAGLIITVVGFGLTIWQLQRTVSASNATKTAIEGASRRMSINHLLILLPQFKGFESDLDNAAGDDDRKLAIRTLVAYSHTAIQVATLLEGDGDGIDPVLIQALRDSARVASATKNSLVTSPTRGVMLTTKKAMVDIAEVSSRMAGLTAQYQTKAA